MDPILKDVTLAAIVRDEKMNPAGGIEKWLEFTLPFVEEAIIVDTGSTDGTREILESAKSKYSNLRVYDHKWEGFADARNASLEEVRTPWVFVLDADEILAKRTGTTSEAYSDLVSEMETNNAQAYNFEFLHVNFPDEYENSGSHNPRLFKNRSIKYQGEIWETILDVWDLKSFELGGIYIAHFLPSKQAKNKKLSHWYNYSAILNESPIRLANRDGWKEMNPFRDNFQL